MWGYHNCKTEKAQKQVWDGMFLSKKIKVTTYFDITTLHTLYI